MRRRYNQFTVFLIIILIASWAISWCTTTLWNSPTNPRALLFHADDTETVFALGLRLPLACADLWSLEQIPQLSGRIAERLITHRIEIIQNARALGSKKALEGVFGVGEATAKRLLRYLDFNVDCIEQRPLLTVFADLAIKSRKSPESHR